MTKALIIEVDGGFRVEDVTPDLPTIKGLLHGGWLEAINGSTPGWHAYIDEEGKFKGLPVNNRATMLANLLGWRVDVLVGPVVFFGNNDPDEADVPDFVLDTFLGMS